jgi:hypothetical protein
MADVGVLTCFLSLQILCGCRFESRFVNPSTGLNLTGSCLVKLSVPAVMIYLTGDCEVDFGFPLREGDPSQYSNNT